ncbi:MAG: tetratricopeptide repeat protein [Anaerolineae bacterium]
MPAIPSALAERLRDTLTQHPALNSDRALRAVFVDARLAPWRDRAPENTTDHANRVAALIAVLCDKTNASGENALVLFLHTLADQTATTDALRDELTQLATELAAQPSVTLTPLHFPPEIEGETLIVIAAFHHSAGVIDTEPHNKIRRAIEKARKEAGFANLRVAIDPAPLDADNRAGASALGDRYNASLVIWGEDTGVEVCVNFYNRKQPDFDAASVRIEETAHTQIAAPSEYGKFITQDLPAQLTFLSLFAVGQSYFATEAYTASVQAIETAVTHLGTSPTIAGAAEAYFRLGWLYSLPLPDIDKALANYTQAIALNPNDEAAASAYNNRGNTYFQLQNYAAALADYTRALELAPQNTNAYNNRGATHAAMQDYKAALADYGRAIELDPQGASAYNNRGAAYYQMQDYKAALADYGRAIELNPQYTAAYNNRGTTYEAMQDYETALADYTRAIELDPQDASTYNNRALTYAEMQDYAAALADYERAIELDPQYARAYFNRGHIYRTMQQHNAALADFAQAIVLDPQDAAAYASRGNTYYALQQYDAALTDYAQAINLNLQDATMYSNRGATFAILQRYDAALADFKRALELDPQLTQAYYNRALTYTKMQDYDAALADYARALEFDPQDAEVHYNIACAHALQNHTAEACVWLEKAITLDASWRDDARTDADFDAIRDAPCLQALLLR